MMMCASAAAAGCSLMGSEVVCLVPAAAVDATFTMSTSCCAVPRELDLSIFLGSPLDMPST